MKTRTVTISGPLYETLNNLALRQQRTHTEILTLALALLAIALPHASQILPAPFQRPPRRSAQTPKS